MKRVYSFCISRLSLAIECGRAVKISDEFAPFIKKDQEADVAVRFQHCAHLLEKKDQPLYEDAVFSVSDAEGVFVRSYKNSLAKARRPRVQSYYDKDKNEVIVRCSALERVFLSCIASCFKYACFEELLLYNKRFILHSSLVETRLGGILFTGPSGIGKSTQADLWVKHKGARLLNGDRAIFHKEEGGWLAYGSPFAGSSNCHVNEGAAVRAIVVLGQGRKNSLARLSPAEAFIQLYQGTTINHWNTDFVDKVSAMLTELAEQLPVYRLICTPDEGAVAILSEELEKGGA